MGRAAAKPVISPRRTIDGYRFAPSILRRGIFRGQKPVSFWPESALGWALPLRSRGPTKTMRGRHEGDDCEGRSRGGGAGGGGGDLGGLGPWTDPPEGAGIDRDQRAAGQGLGGGREFSGHELAAAGQQDRGRERQRDRRHTAADP